MCCASLPVVSWVSSLLWMSGGLALLSGHQPKTQGQRAPSRDVFTRPWRLITMVPLYA